MRLFLFAVLLIFNLEAKSLFSNDEQLDNSKYLGALKDLMIATQKTRGLTNNYQNGNIAAMLLVYGTREDMKKAIGMMESLHMASDPIIHERASKISDALIKLNRKAFRKKPDIVFDEYTELIEQILMLAQSVSNRGSKDLNPLGKQLTSVMMETTLPLCEYTGQLRGMGSGVAAKGKITQEQKYSMLAMIDNIKSLSSKLINEIEKISSSNQENCNSSISTKLNFINQETKKYINLTKKEILDKKKITYDSYEYFTKGTDLISLYISVYNMNNESIAKDSKGWL